MTCTTREFTHNWSGVVVILLGLGWLAQTAAGGQASSSIWAGKVNPLSCSCLSALFIAIAANPELWILHFISPWQAITNPQILEHQLGAALVFILVWLSWRDLKNPAEQRPLGKPLPIVMVTGSLLLLGHAHSTPEVPDALTNLISVPHAIFGACGIFAGTVRWCQLRGLVRTRWANAGSGRACVIALGVSMAFIYREVV